MRCIFCLQDRPGSEEHVFPLAIGGCLTTDRVCSPCNSTLGSRVDAALCDNLLIRMRRARYGLAGNSGTTPTLHELLLGVHTLVDDPTQKVRATYNPTTKKIDLHVIPNSTEVPMPDGTIAQRIILDKRDIGDIPKLIERKRKRRGLPYLSREELGREIQMFELSLSTIENPAVNLRTTIDFTYVRHAMMKIAYELAFLWLGEDYLDDHSAAELRTAICASDPSSTEKLPGYVGDATSCDAFPFWADDSVSHLAYATAYADQGIAIAIRVFDILAAVVWVTADASRYLVGSGAAEKLRFLAIDPLQGTMRSTPFIEEAGRIALKAIASSNHLSGSLE